MRPKVSVLPTVLLIALAAQGAQTPAPKQGSGAQGARTPAPTKVTGADSPECALAVKEAGATKWLEGYQAAETEAEKKATAKYSEGFTFGMEVGTAQYTKNLGDSGGRLKISFSLEDIDGVSSYQFAAAEVIRSYFASSFEVVPDAELKLYISGTKLMIPENVQNVEVSIVTYTRHPFVAGGKTRSPVGGFTFQRQGTLLKGYTETERTQAVRELVYKAITDFLKDWQEASK